MVSPDKRTARSGSSRLRRVVGVSLVASSIAVLLALQSRPGQRFAEAVGHATPPSPAAVKDGFEPRDADTRSIARAMLIGVATIAISIAGLFWLLAAMHARDRAQPPLTRQQSASIRPPGPQLQSHPDLDIAALRRREAGLLTTYRWLDPAHTEAQIPIDRAMALVTGHSLDPTAPTAEPAP